MDNLERPDWDDWFMTLCFVVAQRSLDSHTKCGCVVVSEDNTILSVGYNSPPRGCIDMNIPLTSPEKYDYMEHSESNAINNAARSGICIKNSTFYISGPPCNSCLRKIINVGAKKIICGSNHASMCNNEGLQLAIKTMMIGQDLKIIEYPYSQLEPIFALLKSTRDTIQEKLEELGIL